jgi:hypothetical protein
MATTPFPRVLPLFVGALSDLPTQLRREAQARAIPLVAIDDVIGRLPDNVRSAPCFLDRLTGLWRYDFGRPVDRLPRDQMMVGTLMYTPVPTLLDAAGVAVRWLREEQLSVYFGRLADEGRHQDVLYEMLPMRTPEAGVSATFEVPAAGSTTIDWLIRRDHSPDILIDVKNRIVDLIEYLVAVASRPEAPQAVEPAHDHSSVLRGIENKFELADPNQRLQGAWIVTMLKQEQFRLRQAFDALDGSRVHFVVLNNTHRDGYVLARPGIDAGDILATFGLLDAPDLVFTAGSAFPRHG